MMQFDEAGTIVRPVLWYFAAPTAGYFPGGHLFGAAREWADHKCDTVGIGELAQAVHIYSKGALPAPLGGTGPYCGPLDWWQNGVPSGTPPLTYVDGVPPCCPSFRQPWLVPTALRSVTQVSPVTEAWSAITPGGVPFVSISPSIPSLSAVGRPTSTIGPPPYYTTMGIENSPPNEFSAPMILLNYNPDTFTGLWQAPTAPSPYNQIVLAVTIAPI